MKDKMAKDSKVKVIAEHDLVADKIDLWGVTFERVNGVYIAYLDKQDADAMVKANRVKLA